MRWSFVFCLFLFRIFFSFWSTGVHDRWICQIVFANFQKKTNKKNKNKNLKWSDFLLFFFWNVVTVISSLLFPSIIDVHLEFGTIHVEQRKKNSNFFWKRTLPRPKVKKKKNKKKTANKKQQQQQQQQQKESLTDVPLLNDRYIGLEDVDVVVVFQRCDVTAPAAAAAANGGWVCSFCFVFFVDIFFKKSIFLA